MAHIVMGCWWAREGVGWHAACLGGSQSPASARRILKQKLFSPLCHAEGRASRHGVDWEQSERGGSYVSGAVT